MKTIFETVSADPQLSSLSADIKSAGMSEILSAVGPFTLFAPTNDAFKKIAPDALQKTLSDVSRLTMIIKSHTVSGKQTVAKLQTQTEVQALQGNKLTIANDGGLTVSKAKMISADTECSNGIIHTIDTVLLLWV